jgi:hypothetical protein
LDGTGPISVTAAYRKGRHAGHPETFPDVNDMDNRIERGTPDWGGTGACQKALRTFFGEVRGHDDGCKFWGMEDNDMKFRAARYGLKLAWIHEESSMLHQWHSSDRGKKPVSKLLNDLRFHLSRYRIKKNPKTWGGLP